MRLSSLVILIVLTAGLLSPLSLHINIQDDLQPAVIFALDVCSASHQAISAGGEMPFITECPCVPSHSCAQIFYQPSKYSLKSYLVAFQKEYPPEV